jgi:hypothetical protein
VSTTTARKLYWDYEKEERWLNEMAAKGLALVKYTWGTYRFEQTTPGEWIYRIELLPQDASKPASREYLDFMADAGVQTVSTYMAWVYFRKPASEGPFELFSDTDSRIGHYQRVMTFFGSLTAALLPLTIVNFVNLSDSGRSMGFVLPLMSLQVAGVTIMAVQAVRSWRRVQELKARNRLFE